MPRLSQLMIRSALIWLGLGYTLGGLMLLNKGLPLLPWLWTLRFAHVHVLLFGWSVQIACGVAFWILPRLDSQGSRGNERLVWLCYGALNGAVALALLRGLLPAAPLQRALPPLIAALYIAAALAFAAHAWKRVRAFGATPTKGGSRSG